MRLYYATEGQNDEIIIIIPCGGYVAGFEIRESSEETGQEPVQIRQDENAPDMRGALLGADHQLNGTTQTSDAGTGLSLELIALPAGDARKLLWMPRAVIA